MAGGSVAARVRPASGVGARQVLTVCSHEALKLSQRPAAKAASIVDCILKGAATPNGFMEVARLNACPSVSHTRSEAEAWGYRAAATPRVQGRGDDP